MDLDRARSLVDPIEEAISLMSGALPAAARVLFELLDHDNEWVRLEAAKTILELADKFLEYEVEADEDVTAD